MITPYDDYDPRYDEQRQAQADAGWDAMMDAGGPMYGSLDEARREGQVQADEQRDFRFITHWRQDYGGEIPPDNVYQVRASLKGFRGEFDDAQVVETIYPRDDRDRPRNLGRTALRRLGRETLYLPAGESFPIGSGYRIYRGVEQRIGQLRSYYLLIDDEGRIYRGASTLRGLGYQFHQYLRFAGVAK